MSDERTEAVASLARLVKTRVTREDGSWDWMELERVVHVWLELQGADVPAPIRQSGGSNHPRPVPLHPDGYRPRPHAVRNQPSRPIREPVAPQEGTCRTCGTPITGWEDEKGRHWTHDDEMMEDHTPELSIPE